MLLCFCNKNECNICFEITKTKKCSDCNFEICKKCFVIWTIENQKKSCPHCQKPNTYDFKINNKIFPKNESNINIYEDESNSKNEIICYCSMYCFNQIYHIFIICLVLFFLIICYFLISFGTCSNDNKLCLYCFLMSISLFLIFNVKIIYNMYKSIKSILLFLISVTESLLLITIFSSKNEALLPGKF